MPRRRPEAISHKLLVRAGGPRQVGSGWTYLPAGWRAHRKVEQIIREEMDRIGGQEISMPVQPADAWEKTGRYGIDELLKLEDRKGSPMVLGMTGEESRHRSHGMRSAPTATCLSSCTRSRPRKGTSRDRARILRTREFVMKDAYKFDRDEAGLTRPTTSASKRTTKSTTGRGSSGTGSKATSG